ncbi:palmitoyltransferase ZDHHC16-like [Panonychus citri]|uniref:palmitoyltransferase ZDHHC16-like n=1 Tax=Panonychus citri TaxID=50023 RepID=UPI002307F711|nr:palmitoyltransferase ZDHHC16-like [Panonychus citri]XP_053204896.1 palmitoyltransferase ZDHHC16-like [Panonychus citri]
MSIGLRLASRLLLFFKKRLISLWSVPVTRVSRFWYITKLTLKSLFYNHHLDFGYAADTLLEPIFWFVDHFTSSLGPFFVSMVIIFLTIFVVIAYAIGLPWWWNQSVPVTLLALTIGNYLLVNVIFHYYMALTTPPGQPPHDRLLIEVVSICKKCMTPKPPRTHHCSVCDKCILKMDHHCPWLNNCIGHFNHRFFFSFCFFTWLGTIFVMIFGSFIAYEHFFLTTDDHLDVSIEKTKISKEITKDSLLDSVINNLASMKNGAIIFELLLTVGVFLAIGALGGWHAKLITRGETCVETYINKKEKEKSLKQNTKFINPYDKGPRENWKIFLGLNRSDISIRHILLPSKHLPLDDGLRSH